jgi:hypothetical protein
MDLLHLLTDPGLGFPKERPIGRFDGWKREREKGVQGGGQQARAPPELAGSWPAAEVGKREGGRRRWDLGV